MIEVFLALAVAIAASVSGRPDIVKPLPLPLRPQSSTSSISRVATVQDGTNLTFILSGSNVPTKDSYSEVDAFVKLFTKNGTGTGATEENLGTTDTVQDNKDPQWKKVFWFVWKRGTGQKWHFVVRDKDTIDRDDDVGEVTVNVDDFVTGNQNLTVGLSEGGSLSITNAQSISFMLYAWSLPHMDALNGKSDPYAEVYWRRGQDGNDTLVTSTAVINNQDNPDWKETIHFPYWQKGTDQYLYFKVLDSDTVSTDELIGDLLVDVDAYVTKGTTKVSILEHSNGKAYLAIKPV